MWTLVYALDLVGRYKVDLALGLNLGNLSTHHLFWKKLQLKTYAQNIAWYIIWFVDFGKCNKFGRYKLDLGLQIKIYAKILLDI